MKQIVSILVLRVHWTRNEPKLGQVENKKELGQEEKKKQGQAEEPAGVLKPMVAVLEVPTNPTRPSQFVDFRFFF